MGQRNSKTATTKTRVWSESRDWIAFAYHIRTGLPMALPEILQHMRDYVAGEIAYRETKDESRRKPLPRGIEVEWQWRNNPDRELKTDSIQAVVDASRTGYLKLMLRRLDRDLSKFPPAIAEQARKTVKRLQERERRSRAAKAGHQRRRVWLASHRKYLAQQKRLATMMAKGLIRQRKEKR
jgi:hypothetical protein